jgi:3-methyladenine DNA glycosylase AlkD
LGCERRHGKVSEAPHTKILTLPFRYALTLAPESEFFIRKAIGWALRDYAKWNAPAVVQFVLLHRQQLSPLTVREALKHHAAALRER